MTHDAGNCTSEVRAGRAGPFKCDLRAGYFRQVRLIDRPRNSSNLISIPTQRTRNAEGRSFYPTLCPLLDASRFTVHARLPIGARRRTWRLLHCEPHPLDAHSALTSARLRKFQLPTLILFLLCPDGRGPERGFPIRGSSRSCVTVRGYRPSWRAPPPAIIDMRDSLLTADSASCSTTIPSSGSTRADGH
jgi:hypothetical protein